MNYTPNKNTLARQARIAARKADRENRARQRSAPAKPRPKPKPKPRQSASPRTKKRKKNIDSWSEDDSTGMKRQRLVRWLTNHKRGVDLDTAKLIAVRKYPY